MNKWIVLLLIFCFFISTIIIAFPLADFYLWLNKEDANHSIYLVLSLMGLILSSLVAYLRFKYPQEYERAEKTSHTPHTKYGVYVLVFFFVFMIGFYMYAFLSK